jgi:hypothetical protein
MANETGTVGWLMILKILQNGEKISFYFFFKAYSTIKASPHPQNTGF